MRGRQGKEARGTGGEREGRGDGGGEREGRGEGGVRRKGGKEDRKIIKAFVTPSRSCSFRPGS